jgi:hypothetical protein
MEAAHALRRLREHGVQLRIEGEDIVAAPRTVLTDELRAMIRRHKPDLIDALKPGRLLADAIGGSSHTETPIQTLPAPEARLEEMAHEFAAGPADWVLNGLRAL